MRHYALDLETESLVAGHQEYALQPWRVLSGEAKISLAMTGNSEHVGACPVNRLPEFYNEYVWTWNGVFDTAWLIASGVDCSKARWLDAMSAAKWVYRSQKTDPPYENAKRFSWSLANLAKHCLKDWEHYEEFLEIKKELKEDTDYLLRRCKLDVMATHLLGVRFWKAMTPKQRRGFLIEQETIYPVAKAWIEGCLVNWEELKELAKKLIEQKQKASDKFTMSPVDRLYSQGLTYSAEPLTSEEIIKILASPAQLSHLIYDVWGVPFDESLRSRKAKTDLHPVNKGALLFLVERHGKQFPQLQYVVDYRTAKTKYDKFVNGFLKCREYLGGDKLHHNWRINSTYTGRCAVSSKG